MYSKKYDMLFEVAERPPMPSEGNAKAAMRIVDGASVPQQSRNMTGTIIDWFERSSYMPDANGIIRTQAGERCTFTEYDIVSGDPKVGHKVSFVIHSGGYVSLPTASKVVVDPQTQSKPQTNPAQPQLPEPDTQQLVERLQQIRPAQPEDDLYGQVIFYGDGTNSGVIEADGVRYKFEATDVIRGIPSQGSFAQFNSVDGRAVSVVIA
jgi:hypothetical protein